MTNSTMRLYVSAIAISLSVAAIGQETDVTGDGAVPRSTTLEEVIVTAQKREQNVLDVPMSIVAVSAAEILERGITDIDDIVPLVPSLTLASTAYATPVFTLRGIGFNDNALGGSPNVTVYVDEVPLPYPALTQGALLDPARVEVLKGPQGLLYGQNSTGGAINVISARPSSVRSAGASVSMARFGLIRGSGFAGGPISENVGARFAVQTAQGGAWQRSYLRDDSLGNEDRVQARLLFDWKPSDVLTFSLNLNGWTDQSETQAPQLFHHQPARPSGARPEVLSVPIAPQEAEAADWTVGREFARDHEALQSALRIDWSAGETLRLTSITSLLTYDHHVTNEVDATQYVNFDTQVDGEIDTFFQELRLLGAANRLEWILGVNYADDTIVEKHRYDGVYGSVLFIGPIAVPHSAPTSEQDIRTYAAFTQFELALNDRVGLEAGIRYTRAERDFAGCTRDAGDGGLARATELLQTIWNPGNPPIAIAPGECVTLSGTWVPELMRDTLDEDNVSWRAGLTWKPTEDHMLYANVSRGYKAGSYPNIYGLFARQHAPAVQESLLAYEVGFKSYLAQRSLQVDGAVFYYDYTDKQIRGRDRDPFIGTLVKLLNVPESEARGAELALSWRPMAGLDIRGGIGYLDSEVKNYMFYNNFGVFEDFSGEPFPFTSEISGNMDVQYERPVGNQLSAFVGGSMSYQSEQRSALGSTPFWEIPSYTLLNLRAGVGSSDGRWRATAFVDNAANKYYWTNALYGLDTFYRMTGMPRTYGISLAWRH